MLQITKLLLHKIFILAHLVVAVTLALIFLMFADSQKFTDGNAKIHI